MGRFGNRLNLCIGHRIALRFFRIRQVLELWSRPSRHLRNHFCSKPLLKMPYRSKKFFSPPATRKQFHLEQRCLSAQKGCHRANTWCGGGPQEAKAALRTKLGEKARRPKQLPAHNWVKSRPQAAAHVRQKSAYRMEEGGRDQTATRQTG